MAVTKKKIIFIIGPTGAGKTQVGLSLWRLAPCEFISADSMQVYRGMDIITDKLPRGLRKKYKHHLIDILSPAGEYNVARFSRSARTAIAAILKRKKIPVVIGGTGLYVDSLLYGIFEDNAGSARVRKELEEFARTNGVAPLYERLKKADPEAALKINVNDLKRIIRALEVYESAKKPISALQKQRKGLVQDYDVRLFGLRRDRIDLYGRIDQRVDFMINSGLLGEVRGLLKKKLSKTAYFCIGIREVEGFLKGMYDLDEAVRLIKRNSRRFAKRQMTWFNKNRAVEWIDVKADDDLNAVAQKIHERTNSD